MSANKELPSVEVLRTAAAEGVEASSLRQVAREIGLTPTGLSNFLDGTNPYTGTRLKLHRWYVREGRGKITAYSAFNALESVLMELPPAKRRDALSKLVKVLETVYKKQSKKTPAWLRELSKNL